jgi:hypothetical protein
MNTKLTLRLDDELIREAKEYSQETGKSVSRLVEDYFAVIADRRTRREPRLGSRVRALAGALEGSEVTEDDYRRHLERKYR